MSVKTMFLRFWKLSMRFSFLMLMAVSARFVLASPASIPFLKVVFLVACLLLAYWEDMFDLVCAGQIKRKFFLSPMFHIRAQLTVANGHVHTKDESR